MTPRSLVLALAVAAALPASAEMAPTLAASLREPGALLVLDCGEDRPHRQLARKVADDLRPLRGGERPAQAAADQLGELHWQESHLVILCTDPSDPALLAVAPGLGFHTGSTTDVAGMTLHGQDAGALVSLPHPHGGGLWVVAMVGDGPAALRRLDRHIRNDIATSALVVDDEGERFASLQRENRAWSVLPGHPYRADSVREQFDSWRAMSGARVADWDLDVDVRPAGSIVVDAVLTIEHKRASDAAIWLQLTPRAELIRCDRPCVPHDSRDGRLLLKVESVAGDGSIGLTYEVPLPGQLEAWFLGPMSGYVLPEANWFPRIRGAVDDPYQRRDSWQVDVIRDRGTTVVDAGGTPLLVWGQFQELVAESGGRALLPPGAPPEMEDRARGLLEWMARHAPDLQQLVAVDRREPWCGGDVLLASSTLLELGPVDELDELVLTQVLTERRVRLTEPSGRPVRVKGRVAGAEHAKSGVTVRLWRLRGTWWQEADEGTLVDDGTFTLSGRVRGHLLVTAEASGFAPTAVQLPARGRSHNVDLHLEPVEAVALVCLRCGPDLQAERYPMEEVEPGQYQVAVALGDLHRTYGSFPYAIEVNPGSENAAFVLDTRRPLRQFPSFLDADEFYGDTVLFQWRDVAPRFWIEVPGGLLAPEGWITSSQPPRSTRKRPRRATDPLDPRRRRSAHRTRRADSGRAGPCDTSARRR